MSATSPILKATLQAAVLSAISNTIAQLISCQRAGEAYRLDPGPLVTFVVFSLFSCPPNYLWQSWLESAFPGYTSPDEPGTASSIKSTAEKTAPALEEKVTAATTALADSDVAKVARQRVGEGIKSVKAKTSGDGNTTKSNDSPKKLNIKNTAIKFALDQTLGAVINNALFIAGIGFLKGESLNAITAALQRDFLPLLFAGQKLWPLVSIISFTLVPVEKRTVFGGIVGVGWGIFLSLMVASSGDK